MLRVICFFALLIATAKAVNLGLSCSVDDDCLNRGGGGVECVHVYGSCSQGYCACVDGSYEAALDRCELDQQCGEEPVDDCAVTLIGSSGCENNDCVCPDLAGPNPVIYDGVHYCDEAKLGEACEENQHTDCLAYLINSDSASCVSEVCTCTVGWNEVEVDGIRIACVEVPLGDACDVGTSVCEQGGDCDATDEVCVCPEGTGLDDDTGLCVAPGIVRDQDLGETCTVDATGPWCRPDLYCGVCEREAQSSCQILMGDLDSICEANNDCNLGPAECVKAFDECTVGTCTCPVGQHFATYETCADNVDYGEVCTTDAECEATVLHSVCIEDTTRICDCDGLQHYNNPSGPSCCYTSGWDEDCQNNAECLTFIVNPATGVCVERTGRQDTCGCVDGYVRDGDEGDSCRAVHYGDACEEGNFCEGGATCTELVVGDISRCVCPVDTLWDYKLHACVHISAVGRNPVDEECDITYDTAASSICQPWLTCGSCPLDVDTDPHCKDPDNREGTTRTCANNGDCTAQSENTYCETFYDTCDTPGVCMCNEGLYMSADGTCLSVGNGEACLTAEQCDQWVKHSLCVEGTCQCREDEAEHTDDVTGTVYCAQLLGGVECTADDQCLSFRIDPTVGGCVNNGIGQDDTCGCLVEDYSLVEAEQHCSLGGFGDPCVALCGGTLVCDNTDTCACPTNTNWEEDLENCLHVDVVLVGPEEPCTIDYASAGAQICTPPETCLLCSDEFSGICSGEASDIGNTCTNDNQCNDANSQCLTPYTDCTEGFCICGPNFYGTNECLAVAELGEVCLTTADCQQTTTNVICDDTDPDNLVCACEVDMENNYVASNGWTYCYHAAAGEACADADECLTHIINPVTGTCLNDDTCGCADEYVLSGQECVAVGHNQDCSINNNNDMICASNLQCNGEAGAKTCVCPNNSGWQADLHACVHDEAQMDLTEGEACNVDLLEADGLICEYWLTCGVCLENDDPTDLTCQSQHGAAPSPDPTTEDGGAAFNSLSSLLVMMTTLIYAALNL